MLELCKQYDVPVIAGSDAHFYTEVGELGRAKALIEVANMPERLVVNTEMGILMETINKKCDADEGGME